MEAAPPEASDATVPHGVAKDRLDHPAALLVASPSAFGRQLVPHPFARRRRGRDAATQGRVGGAPVVVDVTCDQSFGLRQRPDVCAGVVAGLGE